jgi:hypothetical protein
VNGTGYFGEDKWQRAEKTGFEVFTAVVMKNSICWDMTPCSPLKVN